MNRQTQEASEIILTTSTLVTSGPVGNQVTGEIRYENEILATLSAIITSGDKSEVPDNQTDKADNWIPLLQSAVKDWRFQSLVD